MLWILTKKLLNKILNFQSRVLIPHMDVRRFPTVGRPTELWINWLNTIDGRDFFNVLIEVSVTILNISKYISDGNSRKFL